MNRFLQQLEINTNYELTENGAVGLSSTLSYCLDAFGSLAAMKDQPEDLIISTFTKALSENRELAMRLLFYVRDIRGGQGMRRVFRVIVKYLAESDPKLVLDNLDNFLFFGRADDLLCLLDTSIKNQVSNYLYEAMMSDIKSVRSGNYPSMLGKWLPSEGKKDDRLAKLLMKDWGISARQYRKYLVELRKAIVIVESYMSNNEWEKIDFSKVPSRASMIYSDAFNRHVEDKYVEYLEELYQGKAKINAKTLFPYDIIHKVLNTNENRKNIILHGAMWDALPNYFEGKEETGLCVVDTSGSMMGTPIEVAISLGMYCADKCKGPFKNKFITFSNKPELKSVVGNNIYEKVRILARDSSWGMNTDLEAVFDLILKTAIDAELDQKDLPSKLYIITDMQFDNATRCTVHKEETFLATMRDKFEKAGYRMPSIVFWNVNARGQAMFQETKYGEDVAMVSGYSPQLFEAVINGTEFIKNEDGSVREKLDPMIIMEKTLMNERYDIVKF